ncbi:MAG: hypothetical protein M3N34_10140 [Pseudomonadota bacterium]|nr:hypothetical protein [Pseudomonadota bacterium]
MKKRVLVAAFFAAAAISAAPAQAHHARHHGYHHAAMSYPDTVTLDGKDYKVCKEGMMDDCVNPRQAGLNFGHVPLDHYRPKDGMPMQP